MSRKTIAGSGLNELLWQRISEVLGEQGRGYGDLWREVIRNKNTYTNWRSRKTVPQISDLEELAKALGVSPGGPPPTI